MIRYASAQEMSEAWGVTKRRVQYLCVNNRIPGAVRIGNMWVIPSDATKPKDERLRKQATQELPQGSIIRKARKALKAIVDQTIRELDSAGLSAEDALHELIVVFSSELLYEIFLDIDVCKRMCEDFFGHRLTNKITNESELRIRQFISVQKMCLDDALSWVYQFATKKSDEFRYKDTQFFTEKYMIKTLVDSIPISSTSIIADPACGGGNFLLYAFDKMVELATDNEDIYERVIHTLSNLCGYEIDQSLAYVAAFNLKYKAITFIGKTRPVSVDDYLLFHPTVYYPKHYTVSGFLDIEWEQQLVVDCDTKQIQTLSDAFRNITIIATNPPFQTIKGMPIELKTYLQTHYPDVKCDMCNAFIERIMYVLPSGGKAALVTQNSWMYLDSFVSMRKKLLGNYSVETIWELGSNAFYDLSGEKANVALVTFAKDKPTESHSISLCLLRNMRIEEIESALEEGIIDPIWIKQTDICENAASRFDMVSTDHLKALQVTSTLYRDFGIPMQGTSTGDAKSLIDYYWRHIGQKEWVLVSKGGGYSRFEGLNSFCVRWGENGEYIKNTKGSAIRNANYFGSTQLVFSDTGTAGLNVRILLPGQIFVASGPGIRVIKGKTLAHLAFLNSRFAAFYVRLLSPKLTIAAGYIGQIPVYEELLNSVVLESNAKLCLEAKKHRLSKRPNNIEFVYVRHNQEKTVFNAAREWFYEDLEDEWAQLVGEKNIEDEIFRVMGLDDSDIQAIEGFIGKREILMEESTAPLSMICEEDLCTVLGPDCLPKRTKPNKKSLGVDGLIEYLAQIKVVPCEYVYRSLKSQYAWLEEQYLDLYMHAMVLSAADFRDGNDMPISCNEIIMRMGVTHEADISFSHQWIATRFNKVHSSVFEGKPVFEYNSINNELARTRE